MRVSSLILGINNISREISNSCPLPRTISRWGCVSLSLSFSRLGAYVTDASSLAILMDTGFSMATKECWFNGGRRVCYFDEIYIMGWILGVDAWRVAWCRVQNHVEPKWTPRMGPPRVPPSGSSSSRTPRTGAATRPSHVTLTFVDISHCLPFRFLSLCLFSFSLVRYTDLPRMLHSFVWFDVNEDKTVFRENTKSLERKLSCVQLVNMR